MNNTNTANLLSYFGYCTHCKKDHSLPSIKAVPYALKLMEQLRVHCRIDLETPIITANPQLSTKTLYTDIGGKMFGVLVCEDVLGNEVILRAFSSTHNGTWNVAGWAPHIASEAEFMEIVKEGNKEIHPLTASIQSLKKGSDEWLLKISQRKTVSQNVLTKLFALYEVFNFKNQKRSLTEAFNIKKGIPNGTGDCCAPKLLNYAAKNNLKPVSIAEFYWGKTSLSGLRVEGEFYSSCADKCQPLLGFMLCGI